MHKYVIMGVQGCGKGTQANRLETEFDLVHISVGDMFRWNVRHHTKLAAKVKRIMARGELVSDEIVEEMMSRRLAEHDWNYGFILDGFPRNVHQATFFLESYDIDAVIHIHVPDEVVIARITNRRLCSQCGTDFNLLGHTPKVPNTCDMCGGELLQREDDNPAAVKKRLTDYHEKTEPILDLFRRKELVVTIDGTLSADEVQQQIRDKVPGL